MNTQNTIHTQCCFSFVMLALRSKTFIALFFGCSISFFSPFYIKWISIHQYVADFLFWNANLQSRITALSITQKILIVLGFFPSFCACGLVYKADIWSVPELVTTIRSAFELESALIQVSLFRDLYFEWRDLWPHHWHHQQLWSLLIPTSLKP